jgi:hypothetical protein
MAIPERKYFLRSEYATFYSFAAILIYTLTTNSVFGQSEMFRKYTVGVGFSPAWIRGIDRQFSSQIYSGFSPGFSVAAKLINRNHNSHYGGSFYTSGNLSFEKSGDVNVKYSQLGMEYSNLFNISKSAEEKLEFSIGGAATFLRTERIYSLVNKSNSFETVISIGVNAELVWILSEAGRISIRDRIVCPIVSALAQPSFGSNVATGGSAIDQWQIASFSNYFRIRNGLYLSKQIGERSGVSFGYQWDYYRIKTEREVRQASHTVSLVYHFTF